MKIYFDPEKRLLRILQLYNREFLTNFLRVNDRRKETVLTRRSLKETVLTRRSLEEFRLDINPEPGRPDTLGEFIGQNRTWVYSSEIKRHPTLGCIPGKVWLVIFPSGFCRLIPSEDLGGQKKKAYEEKLTEVEIVLNKEWQTYDTLSHDLGRQIEDRELCCYIDFNGNFVSALTLYAGQDRLALSRTPEGRLSISEGEGAWKERLEKLKKIIGGESNYEHGGDE